MTAMQYRRLGCSGLQLSALSLGTWVTFGQQLDRSAARDLVACALDHGITFFDGAENYAFGAAETVLGEVLADLRPSRDAYCVSSKVCFGSVEHPLPTQRGLSRKHVTEACHLALRRLRVEHLDLYYCHRPDADTPIAETVAAMDALVRQGKVLYWGTSEWPAESIREAFRIARAGGFTEPTMEQPQYNLLRRERVEYEYAALYRDFGLGTTIWSPLASGLLSGKYNDGVPADSRAGHADNGWLRERLDSASGRIELAKARRITAIASDLGVAPAQLALAWCLKNPHVSSVILGATRPAQIEQNVGALDVLAKLDAGVMRQLDAAVAGGFAQRAKRFVGRFRHRA
jgi:voltage-dependent potassium channel beta subunit